MLRITFKLMINISQPHDFSDCAVSMIYLSKSLAKKKGEYRNFQNRREYRVSDFEANVVNRIIRLERSFPVKQFLHFKPANLKWIPTDPYSFIFGNPSLFLINLFFAF